MRIRLSKHRIERDFGQAALRPYRSDSSETFGVIAA